jgi:acyl-CoA thioesterase YciA
MEFRTRKLIKHADLNPSGNLFGGRVMEWIDEEAAIFAKCQLPFHNQLVTKLITDINFTASASLGDIVEIGMVVDKVGTTSITLKGVVRNKTTKQEIVTIDKIVFVNLDEKGKPIRHDVHLVQAKMLRGDPQPAAYAFGQTVIEAIPQFTYTTSIDAPANDHEKFYDKHSVSLGNIWEKM